MADIKLISIAIVHGKWLILTILLFISSCIGIRRSRRSCKNMGCKMQHKR